MKRTVHRRLGNDKKVFIFIITFTPTVEELQQKNRSGRHYCIKK